MVWQLPYKPGQSFCALHGCIKQIRHQSNTFLSIAVPSFLPLSVLQQAVKRKAENVKSFARDIYHSATHPSRLVFAVATGLTLGASLLLQLGAFEPLCRFAFALALTYCEFMISVISLLLEDAIHSIQWEYSRAPYCAHISRASSWYTAQQSA